MDYSTIKNKLNKVYEDMGGGMVSSAAGIVGMESLPKKKKKRVISNLDRINEARTDTRKTKYDSENPYELWFKNKVSRDWDVHMSWSIGEFNEVKDCGKIPLAGDSYNREQKYFGKPQGWTEWKITLNRKDITSDYCKGLKTNLSNNEKILEILESKIHRDIKLFIQKNSTNKNMTVLNQFSKQEEWLKFILVKTSLRKEFLETYPEVIKKGFIPFAINQYQQLYAFNINDKVPVIYFCYDIDDPESLIKDKHKGNITFKDFISMNLKGIK